MFKYRPFQYNYLNNDEMGTYGPQTGLGCDFSKDRRDIGVVRVAGQATRHIVIHVHQFVLSDTITKI